MCDFAEHRALILRLALGVWGIGGPGSVNRLIRWLGRLVEIERSGKGRGKCIRREDGGLLLQIPLHLGDGWSLANTILHELGHGLTESAEWRSEERSEEEAESFRLAWILPRELARGACRDSSLAVQQLAYSTGLSPDAICERLDWHLTHRPPNLTVCAPWSARTYFTSQLRYTQRYRRLVLTGEKGEWIERLCETQEEFGRELRDLHLALCALTPAEFLLQQADHRTHLAPLVFPPLELAA